MSPERKPDYREQIRKAEVLYNPEQITGMVSNVAQDIKADYNGEGVVLVGVLKGAYMFLGDLSRELHRNGVPHIIDFAQASSYGDGTESSGDPIIRLGVDPKRIVGKKVIVVEDIVDTGHTIQKLMRDMEELNPDSLKLAALLSKPDRREVDVQIDYLGDEIEDRFVIGYGLDAGEEGRELPYIVAID